jgi:hypothetical protein
MRSQEASILLYIYSCEKIYFKLFKFVIMLLRIHKSIPHKSATELFFINPSHQSVSVYVYPFDVAMQRLGKNVTAATNTHETTEELLDDSFSVLFIQFQGKLGSN